MVLPTISLAGIATLLTPFGTALVENLVSQIFAAHNTKKAAEAEARKLLFKVYQEVRNNLSVFNGFDNKTFKNWKINSAECAEFIAQFEIKAMNGFLSHNVSISGMRKIKGSNAYSAMCKAAVHTKEIVRLSRMSNRLLSERPKVRTSVRLSNIKNWNLEVYRGLFK